jgi:hypothetical protein
MDITLNTTTRYPMPDFMEGQCASKTYSKWLRVKADTLLRRDKKRGKPYAAAATQGMYAAKIHQAVVRNGERDPYTGEALAWELIGTWDTSRKQPEGYKKKFALLPTVDHIDQDVLEFEICSWRANGCKSDLYPAEFVDFCKKVAAYKKTGGYIRKWLSLRRKLGLESYA